MLINTLRGMGPKEDSVSGSSFILARVEKSGPRGAAHRSGWKDNTISMAPTP